MPATPLLNGLLNVPDQSYGGAPTNGLAPPNLLLPPDSGAPTQAQGVTQAGSALWQWLQGQRAQSRQMGLLDPATGLPTQAGAVDAARQYANALMMGTTAPGSAGLPMDAASRLARARQQGFDTGTTWYHGTGGDHTALDLSQALKVSSGDAPGLWFTQNVGEANGYAQNAAHVMDGEPRIVQAHLRADNPVTVNFPDAPHNPEIDGKPVINGKPMDFESNTDVVDYAKRNGHDVVFMPDGNFSEASPAAVVLKHGRVRSTDAAFDPANIGSNELAH